MEFKFTEEQEMIRDTAEAFLAQVSPSSAVRKAMSTDLGYEPELWQRITREMVWQAIHIPQEYGGMGLGYVELAATMEQMGRRLLCAPFFSTVCPASNALLLAGTEPQRDRYLPQIVEGVTATLAYTGTSGKWDASTIDVVCSQQGEHTLLNGECRFVPDGHSADFIVVAARADDSKGQEGISLFVVPANTAGISRKGLPTMDQTRRLAHLTFDNVALESDATMLEPGVARL